MSLNVPLRLPLRRFKFDSEYVLAVAETGAFEAIFFERAFEAAFKAFTCMRAIVRLRCWTHKF